MKENQITERWVSMKYIRTDETVLDFMGLYEVSDHGRVKSLNYRKTGKTKVLSMSTSRGKDGSIVCMVVLYKDGKRYTLPTHRLVLSSFRPKGHPEGYFHGAVVNHKTERTATSCINKLSNLEWATQRQNCNTEHSKNLRSKTQTNHPAKSKRISVRDLNTGRVTIYPSAGEVGRTLGIRRSTVVNCISKYGGYYRKGYLRFKYV